MFWTIFKYICALLLLYGIWYIFMLFYYEFNMQNNLLLENYKH